MSPRRCRVTLTAMEGSAPCPPGRRRLCEKRGGAAPAKDGWAGLATHTATTATTRMAFEVLIGASRDTRTQALYASDTPPPGASLSRTGGPAPGTGRAGPLAAGPGTNPRPGRTPVASP